MKRALITILGIALLLANAVMVFAHESVEAYLADAYTGHRLGAGITATLVDPFPEPGDTVEVEVTAHGGEHAMLTGVEAGWTEAPPPAPPPSSPFGGWLGWQGTRAHPEQVREVREQERRSHTTAVVRVALPENVRAGQTFTLHVRGARGYDSPRSFSFLRDGDIVERLTVPIHVYGATGRAVGRVLLGARALLAFLIFGALCFGGVYWMKAQDRRPTQPGDPSPQFLGVLLVSLLAGAGFVGYWLFALPAHRALGVEASALSCAPFLLAWFAAPIGISAKFAQPRDRGPMIPYAIALGHREQTSVYREQPEELEAVVTLEELAEIFEEQGYRVRLKGGELKATKTFEKSEDELRIRVAEGGSEAEPGQAEPDQELGLEELVIRSSAAFPILEMAKTLAEDFGTILVTYEGRTHRIRPDTKVASLVAEDMMATLEKNREQLEALRKILEKDRS